MDAGLHPGVCTCMLCALERELIRAANAVVMPAVLAGKLSNRDAAELLRTAFTRRGAKLTALHIPGDTILASARLNWAVQTFRELGLAVIAQEAQKPKRVEPDEKPVIMQ